MTRFRSSGGSDFGAVFGYADFRLFLLVRFFAVAGQMMQGVAVGWQVYALTNSPLSLGYVGLVLFLPQVLLSLITGATADRFERRRVLLVCLVVETSSALLLLWLAAFDVGNVRLIFAVLILFGVARAFQGPAMQSLVPLLVPREHFPNAVAWSSQAMLLATMTGPALGGLLYGLGAPLVYGTVAALFGSSALAVITMKTRLNPEAERGGMLERLLAGVRFVASNRIVLGAISLDLFAVLFGGATALLPVFARDILAVGPWGLGMLRSAPAIGAALCALALARRPLRRHVGRTMFVCVALFGLATIVFGLSRSFLLSFASLVVLGASDMISVYVRQTLVQLGTPDAMRGRVSAVNLVFIGASNELGEFESGVTADLMGPVPAVVFGGLGTLAVVALWAWKFKELRQADRLDDKEA